MCRAAHPVTALALVTLDGAFTGRGWQGPTLTGSLKGVKSALALWKPTPSRRCIWEQLLHASYWKLTILRVFDPSTSLTVLHAGSNWPRLDVTTQTPLLALAKRWKADLDRLKEVHRALRDAVASLPEAAWHTKPRRASSTGSAARSSTYAEYLAGAAAHDAYHTGQIRLLKRLHAEQAKR